MVIHHFYKPYYSPLITGFLVLLLFSHLYSEEAGQSEQGFGSLEVLSSPGKAIVILGKDSIGTTPFFSDTIKAGTYKIKIVKPDYLKCRERIVVPEGVIFQISKDLVPKRKIQNLRRVSFSVLTLVFSAAGALMITKVNKSRDVEDEAWNSYMQKNLTQPEYDELYETYTNKVNDTKSKLYRRNTYIAVACVSCIGFVVSIPF